jgi:hypothetical protein
MFARQQREIGWPVDDLIRLVRLRDRRLRQS